MSEKAPVALFLGPTFEWVRTHLDDRIERLRREGFVVHVAAGDDGRSHALSPEVVGRPFPTGVAGWFGAFVLVQSHIIENQPVLVHGFGTPWAWFGAVAASRADVPGVFATVEDGPGLAPIEFLGSLGLPVDELIDSAHRFLAARVDKYITTSESALERATPFVPGNKLELALGGYGVDVQGLNPYDSNLPDADELRQTFRVSARAVVGVSPRTPDSLVDQFVSDLDQRYPGVEVVRQGESWGAVRGLGTISPRLFMRLVDLAVAFDGDDPMFAQTASAAGRAVVAADNAGHRDVVVHDETGRIVSSQDLAAAAASALDDPKWREQAGVRGRSRAVSRFDRRQVDDQMVRLYDDVLRRKMT